MKQKRNKLISLKKLLCNEIDLDEKYGYAVVSLIFGLKGAISQDSF